MKSFLTSLWLGCLFGGLMYAQASAVVSGVVLGGGNKPVKGYAVLRTGGHEIAQTALDDKGRFRFDAVPNGKYTVHIFWSTADLTGDGDAKRDVEIKEGKSAKADFLYGALPDPADEVQFPIRATVTVSAGEDQLPRQVSKTIDIIGGAEMRDRADFALVESIRTIPGFRVQQLGGFGRTANIKTRGLRNQDTAVLIDGIRFRDPTAITGDASPFISDFTLTSVERIEVLRGSGSALYGTNAIGGVLDFQTPEARQGTHGQFGGAFGGLGLGRFRGNISHGTRGGKFGIAAGLSRTVYGRGIDGDDDAHNTNFQTRIDANPYSRTNISGRIFVSDADVRLNVNPDTFGLLPVSNATIIDAKPNVNFTPDADDPDAIQRSRFFSGQLSVTQIVNTKLLLSGYYQGLTTRRRNDDGPLGPGFQSASTSIFDGQIHTANAKVTWTPTSRNTVTAGYEFELERFGNDGRTPSGTGNFFTRARQRSHTFYAQDLVSLLDGNLQLAGGFRVQQYGLGAPRFSLANAPYSDLILSDPPKAVTFDGAVSHYFQSSGTKLRAHVGNGYRVPSLYERFGTFSSTFGTPSFVALGDPFLKPEKTVAFDAGVEQNAANDRVRLSATYFYTRLTNIIGFGNVVPPIGMTQRPFGGYENQKGGLARGAEFSVKARPRASADIFSSYTFTNSDQRTSQVAGSGIIRSLGIPDHQFTLVATQRFGRAWVNFDFLATSTYLAPIFSSSNFNSYVYRFRGNRKGDLTAGYTFGFAQEKHTLRLYGTVENIFNNEYYENGFRTAKANARIGATFGF